MYLTHKQPGTGKTMLGMHFLEEGHEEGWTILFIHGEESEEEILANGASIGIDIEDSEFLDIGPDSDFFAEDYTYDLVEPSDLEEDRYTKDIHEAIRGIDPDREVSDPITQLRYVEANEYQFRKRILSFMRFLKEQEVTVLTTATPSADQVYSTEIQSLSDGIVKLTRGDGDGGSTSRSIVRSASSTVTTAWRSAGPESRSTRGSSRTVRNWSSRRHRCSSAARGSTNSSVAAWIRGQ